MVNEPSYLPQEYGWIEVICGGMFSGKTEELIRRASALRLQDNRSCYKPSVDNRYSSSDVVSHDQSTIPSLVVKNVEEIIDISADFRVICIDEAQFFDNDLLSTVNELANNNKRVIMQALTWIMRVNFYLCPIC